MNLGKSVLLHAYYHGSLPYRRFRLRRMAADAGLPITVLFYHCVSPKVDNSWTVSPENFARQIEWLSRHFDLISLEETQRRLREGNRTPAVSITFDDGYADNEQVAIPLLLEREIPFTYFVTLDPILRGEPFEHDVLIGSPRKPNRIETIADMAARGVEIGAHGRHHVNMGQIENPDTLWDEIAVAGSELGRRIGRTIRYFAFPFGQFEQMSLRAMDACRQAGYAGVCSAYGGYNFPGDDPFHLQRFAVDNDLIRLKNRASIDFRHLATPRFEEATEEHEAESLGIHEQPICP